VKKFLFLLLTISSIGKANAQNLYAYTAYNDNLNIFDSGTFTKAEMNKVQNLYVGYSYIAYKSYNSKLMFYWRNNLNDINESSFISKAMPSKYLFAYLMGKQLKVIDKGKDRTLSNWCERAVCTDSIVGYYDGNKNQHFIYYNGDIFILDDVLNYDEDRLNKTNTAIGKNMVMYVNSYKKIKLLYRGEFLDISDWSPDLKFDCGSDIAIYNNSDHTSFKAFCNGLEYTLESTMPESYQLGNGMVAYVDMLGQFKVFYNNKSISLLSAAPDKYEVVDSIISYSDNVHNWSIFYAGKAYRMLNYVPKLIKISDGTVAFIDNLNRLNVFQNGETKIISYEIVTEFNVNGTVVSYTLGDKDVKIYWNGTTY
jgi:hypothetical protein